MRRQLWKTGALLAIIAGLAFPIRAQDTDTEDRPKMRAPFDPSAPLFKQVDGSIARAMKYLLSRQNDDGSFGGERSVDHRVGTTALVGLALLNCGQSHQSPQLVKAIAYLKKTKITGIHQTYAYSLRAAFYSQLPEPVRKTELPADLRWLIAAAIQKGNLKGLYGYQQAGEPAGLPDLSNAQYGVLGVWYAALAGLEVPTSYWRNVEESWQGAQNRDGGWGYLADDRRSYGSMTAAGAATLFITNDYLHAGKQKDLSKPTVNDELDRAIAWLGRHYNVEHNPGRDQPLDRTGEAEDEGKAKNKTKDRGDVDDNIMGGLEGILNGLGMGEGVRGFRGNWFVHYMLFAYERVGEASGLTRFGQTKWFDRGARFLIRTQDYNGSWSGSMAGAECDTSWSLLFLSLCLSSNYKEEFPVRSRDESSLDCLCFAEGKCIWRYSFLQFS